MKKLIYLIMSTSLLLSCAKNDLKKEFNCKGKIEMSDVKQYRDILKKFKIDLPKNWKTNLYYDEFSSELFAADTTRGLTNSYILDISWRQGELNIDKAFEKALNDSLQLKENLKTARSGNITFKKFPAFWNLSSGEKSGYPYNFLQVFVKTEIDEYIVMTSKVYGNENVNERLCESVDIFENLNILN